MPGRKKQKRISHPRRPTDEKPSPSVAEETARSLANRLRQVAFGLTLLGAALGPLAPTIERTLVLRLIVQMLFIFAGALWVMSMAMEGRVRLRQTGLHPCLLLLSVVALASIFNAANKYATTLAAFMWLSGIIL